MFLTNLGTARKLQESYAKYKYLYEVPEDSDREYKLYSCASVLDSVSLLTYTLPGMSVQLKSIILKVLSSTTAKLEYTGDSTIWCTVDISDDALIMDSIYDGVLRILAQVEAGLEVSYNILMLNNMTSMLINTYNVPYDISFYCGEGIGNLTNSSISIGIDYSIVCNLESILYRGGLMPLGVVFTGFEQTFTSLPNIIECVRRRTWFSKALGFYTRKNPKTIIRSSYHSQHQHISNGIGYAESDDFFALIRVNSVTAEELEVLKKQYGSDMVYSENNEPKSRDCYIAKSQDELEKYKKRLNKKGISYKLQQSGTADAPEYKLIFNQFNICAVVYGPVNLDTYAKPHGVVNAELFSY